MGLLGNLLVFHNDGAASTVGTVFFGLAALSITLSFGPQFLEIVRKKDTSGISLKIFFLHYLIGLCFFISTMFNFFNTNNGGGANHYITCAIFVYINVFVLFACGRIVEIKYENQKQAKKCGISELEYCQQLLNTPKVEVEKTP